MQDVETAQHSSTFHYISTLFGMCLYTFFGLTIMWGSDKDYSYAYFYAILFVAIFPAALYCFLNKQLRKKVNGLNFLLIAYIGALINTFIIAHLHALAPAHIFAYIVLAIASSESFGITTKRFAIGMFTLICLLNSSFLFYDMIFPKLAFVAGMNLLMVWRLYNGLLQLNVNNTLIREKQKIQVVFDTVDEGILLIDSTSDTILEANATANKLYGFENSEIIGKKFKIFRSMAPTDYVKLEHHRHVWQQKTDSNVFPAEMQESQLPDTDQKIVTIRDLTHVLEEEAKALKSKQAMEVQARLVSLGEMAGGVAHEINNPMTVISGTASKISVFIRGTEMEEKLSKEIETIKTMIKRIVNIISGLRKISREGSQDPMVETPISNITENVLGISLERFTNKGIKLEINSVDKDLKILCREVEISQVLINILNNAFDAIEEQGITLESFCRMNVVDTQDNISIEVIDSGPGIDNKVKEKIYQPFFTTKPVGKGTGLGLSISKTIIDNHGGQLYFKDSKPTTCVIALPKIK